MRILASSLGVLFALAAGGEAMAAPGNAAQAQGQATATIATPLQVQQLQGLRFGSFPRPSVTSRMTISPAGAVFGTIDTTSYPSPRGPARFRIAGQGSRFFILNLPGAIAISNGSSTMTVDQFTANTAPGPLGFFGPSGVYDLRIGGRLTASPGQAAGTYSGTFTFTVLYL